MYPPWSSSPSSRTIQFPPIRGEYCPLWTSYITVRVRGETSDGFCECPAPVLSISKSALMCTSRDLRCVWCRHLLSTWIIALCCSLLCRSFWVLQEDTERERERKSESQWFPPAPVAIVSPVAHLTHSLCWAMGKSDWAHYSLLRTDTGSRERLQLIVNGHHHQCCHYQECVAICQGPPYLTWLSSASSCLCALETNERRLLSLSLSLSRRVLVQWGMDVVSWDYWHALSRSSSLPPPRPPSEWGGMDDRYREGHVR